MVLIVMKYILRNINGVHTDDSSGDDDHDYAANTDSLVTSLNNVCTVVAGLSGCHAAPQGKHHVAVQVV